jgi:hypothetical protein
MFPSLLKFEVIINVRRLVASPDLLELSFEIGELVRTYELCCMKVMDVFCNMLCLFS